MTRNLYQCPCCQSVYAATEPVEWFDLPLDDEQYVGEPENEYFDEDLYTSPESYTTETHVVHSEPHVEFPNRSETPYPVVADEFTTRADGKTVVVNHDVGARTGNISTETTYNQSVAPLVRQKPRRGQMQPPGAMQGVFRPQRQNINASAHGVIVDPNDARNDFDPSDGMTAVERFTDNGLQYVYEQDLRSRGFH